MPRNFSLVAEMPPISLLAPAADAAGRTSAFRSIKGADKAYIVVRINQGNAAEVTLTPLQGTDVAGDGSAGLTAAVPIWLNDNTGTSDTFVQQTAGTSFTTDATLAEKIVIFEVLPEAALNLAGGYRSLAVSTSASNAANITSAELLLCTDYQGASPLSSYVN